MGSGWRIVSARHADTPFSGEGARQYGGRWNSPGVSMVYVSEHRSLAALEILVHIRSLTEPFSYRALVAEWDDSLVETLLPGSLPADWRTEPPGVGAMRFGDAWVRSERSAVLAVPSVLIPEERNFLLNPLHRDFRKITIQDRGEFILDGRLLR